MSEEKFQLAREVLRVEHTVRTCELERGFRENDYGIAFNRLKLHIKGIYDSSYLVANGVYQIVDFSYLAIDPEAQDRSRPSDYIVLAAGKERQHPKTMRELFDKDSDTYGFQEDGLSLALPALENSEELPLLPGWPLHGGRFNRRDLDENEALRNRLSRILGTEVIERCLKEIAESSDIK